MRRAKTLLRLKVPPAERRQQGDNTLVSTATLALHINASRRRRRRHRRRLVINGQSGSSIPSAFGAEAEFVLNNSAFQGE